jgi:RNA polymerase sigma-70 factor (ECF subfamily)
VSSSSTSGGLLLDHLDSLRALARRLTRDAHAADDAVQDTVVAALASRGPRGGGVRAWLAAILRNAVRQRTREQARRAAREAEAARSDETPSTADVIVELALHRRLVELVRELDEPYRRVVFLRFWRGLRAREIGELLGVPHKTVHTRIERGLARLRARLDAERGGRDAWTCALATSLGSAPAAPGVLGVILFMKTKLLLGIAAVLVTVLVLLPWGGSPPPDAVAASARGAPPAAPPRAQGSAAADPARRLELVREVVPLAAPPASRAVPAGAAPMVQGFVHDLGGRAVAGLRIAFERSGSGSGGVPGRAAPDVAVTSGADGSFLFPMPATQGCLTVVSEAWVAVRRPWLGTLPPSEPPAVIVAPARSYAGQVVDADGAAVAGARVVVVVAAELVPTRTVADRVVALPNDLCATTTDAEGRFALPRVGWLPGVRLVAERAPMPAASLALPEASAHDLVLTMGRVEVAATWVHGVVLDAATRPVAGAFVSVGGESVRSAADGRFTVPWAGRERPVVVRAARADLGAAAARLTPGQDQPGWHEDRPITVQFATAPGELRGRVLDADGRPVSGVRVWTPDLTWFGRVSLEEDGHEVSRDTSVEGIAAGANTPLAVAADTGAGGEFVLRGLLPRRYELFALHPSTLAAAGPVAAAPGADVELRLERTALRAVAGRVVSRAGTPLAGVRVAAGRAFDWRPAPRAEEPWAGSPMRPPRAAHVFRDGGVTTDAGGRFSFPGMVVEGARLSISGDTMFPTPPFELAPGLPLEDLVVTVQARSTFRVLLDQPDEADGFTLARAEGGHVPLFVRVEGFVMSLGRVALVGGRSPEAYTPAGEVSIVLLRGGKEVRRVAVHLREGGVHDVRL